jgi:hypothetical protein
LNPPRRNTCRPGCKSVLLAHTASDLVPVIVLRNLDHDLTSAGRSPFTVLVCSLHMLPADAGEEEGRQV